ncbi:hypothetical protein GCM10011588_71620 [Nocardia jinanensis]|uniref:Uncharacterized protein n=1 Tax=Nocardia jinanensis TaxID=382504 RepID=A0A917RYV5_9NOCA|nr:hypothetical protein GCM10011588_71620 [Nocardia jinanensis]
MVDDRLRYATIAYDTCFILNYLDIKSHNARVRQTESLAGPTPRSDAWFVRQLSSHLPGGARKLMRPTKVTFDTARNQIIKAATSLTGQLARRGGRPPHASDHHAG